MTVQKTQTIKYRGGGVQFLGQLLLISLAVLYIHVLPPFCIESQLSLFHIPWYYMIL